LPPVLVNREQGGYYLVPYAAEGNLAGAALLINAYTGQLQEAGAFAPSRLLAEGEARRLALEHLGAAAPKEITVEAVSQGPVPGAARYSPTWKVEVDGKVVGVTQQGEVLPRISAEIFAVPVAAPRLGGIAAAGERLWVMDRSRGEILELQRATGGVLRRLGLDLAAPKGLAFDGQLLWVADEAAKTVRAFDPQEGQRVRAIPLEIPSGKGFRSLEALAWDGKFLWTAISAGFSSSINQIDPATGRIVRSFFADCDPRGLASDGLRLWTLCFNGPDHPAVVDERLLGAEEGELTRSRRFIRKLEGRDPAGLSFDGQFLWYADAGGRRAVRLAVDVGEEPR
jgi:hypothetical protein